MEWNLFQINTYTDLCVYIHICIIYIYLFESIYYFWFIHLLHVYIYICICVPLKRKRHPESGRVVFLGVLHTCNGSIITCTLQPHLRRFFKAVWGLQNIEIPTLCCVFPGPFATSPLRCFFFFGHTKPKQTSKRTQHKNVLTQDKQVSTVFPLGLLGREP